MSEKENMSQRPATGSERARKSRANRPQSAARDKEKQRQLETVYRFHIVRNLNPITQYPIPESIDQSSEMFARVKATYLEERAEAVEVCCE